jgi:uncharacterized protein (TIGR00730 family)
VPDNSAQKSSPSYRLAALDSDFLLGPSMRGARFMMEFEKTQEILSAHRIVSTLVVFGSARAREGMPGNAGHWYAAARDFARIASERGGAKDGCGGERHNVIATGGGPGIMEAANRGAADAGAPSIGFNVVLPHEQEPNAYSTPALTFNFHYFAMRKMHLAMRARGLVAFPGGFGTLDELFEILTLQQTRKMHPCKVVLFDRAFWSRLIDFDLLVAEGLVAAGDPANFAYAETPEEVWSALSQDGLTLPK